jgi:hypothetical protein
VEVQGRLTSYVSVGTLLLLVIISSIWSFVLSTPPGVDSISRVVGSYASANYPNLYGGSVLADDETHIDVYLTSLEPGVTSTLRSLAPAGTLSFVLTPNSLATLEPIERRIMADQSGLVAGTGVRLVEIGLDVQTGTVVLKMKHLTQAATEGLYRRFGASHLTVENLAPDMAYISYLDGVGTTP